MVSAADEQRAGEGGADGRTEVGGRVLQARRPRGLSSSGTADSGDRTQLRGQCADPQAGEQQRNRHDPGVGGGVEGRHQHRRRRRTWRAVPDAPPDAVRPGEEAGDADGRGGRVIESGRMRTPVSSADSPSDTDRNSGIVKNIPSSDEDGPDPSSSPRSRPDRRAATLRERDPNTRAEAEAASGPAIRLLGCPSRAGPGPRSRSRRRIRRRTPRAPGEADGGGERAADERADQRRHDRRRRRHRDQAVGARVWPRAAKFEPATTARRIATPG